MYNGNISGTSWKSKTDNVKRSYNYSYDDMNRLNRANYVQTFATSDTYNEGPVTYDKNGNILSLERRGFTGQTNPATGTPVFGVIDKLTYTYGQYTNRLDRVKDDATASAITGFTDGVDTALEYHYDANGNMVKDFNKRIGTTSTDGIKYNYLNLPTEIKVENPDNVLRKIEYVYDAVGTKLKKTVTTGSTIEITEYCGGFVYNRAGATANALLQFFPTEEGYVTIAANGDFKYTYQYKDHLGNVRLSYTDTNGNNAIVASEVIEESNYYPFGLQHKGYNNVVSIQNGNSTAQKWKYNDTEYNESFALNMYEMPFRSYDPALARWTTIDPILHYSMSTYNAFDNNPVFWADPSGADAYNTAMALFNRSGSGITTYERDSFHAGGNIFTQTGHMSDEDVNRLLSGKQENETLAGGGGGNGNGWFKKTWKNVKHFFGWRDFKQPVVEVTIGTPILEFGDAINNVAGPIGTIAGIVEQGSIVSGTTITTVQALERFAVQETIDAAKILKITGKISLAANAIQIGNSTLKLIDNPTAGNLTRVGVQLTIIGIETAANAFLPGSGIIVGLGLNILESAYGERLYNYMDTIGN